MVGLVEELVVVDEKKEMGHQMIEKVLKSLSFVSYERLTLMDLVMDHEQLALCSESHPIVSTPYLNKYIYQTNMVIISYYQELVLFLDNIGPYSPDNIICIYFSQKLSVFFIR